METTGFDAAHLERWRAFIGGAQLRVLAQGFLAKLAADVAGLGATLATGDHSLIAREAHALVGSAANFGATGVSELARAIERAARAGGGPYQELHAALAAEVPRLSTALQGWLATAGD